MTKRQTSLRLAPLANCTEHILGHYSQTFHSNSVNILYIIHTKNLKHIKNFASPCDIHIYIKI